MQTEYKGHNIIYNIRKSGEDNEVLCKNRRVVLTQLVYHNCILKIKNNPHVFAFTQFKFQKQPSCFCSECTKHEDCFSFLNCNCGKQAGLK